MLAFLYLGLTFFVECWHFVLETRAGLRISKIIFKRSLPKMLFSYLAGTTNTCKTINFSIYTHRHLYAHTLTHTILCLLSLPKKCSLHFLNLRNLQIQSPLSLVFILHHAEPFLVHIWPMSPEKNLTIFLPFSLKIAFGQVKIF